MKYRLLIIDDESQRNDSYQNLLAKDFEIEIQNDIVSHDLINAIQDPKIDCIIVDMVLSKMSSPKKESFEKVMDMIGEKKPVILISRYFNKIASWINDQAEKKNIISFVGWDELYDEAFQIKDQGTAENFRVRIKMALNSYYHRSNSKKEPNESIVLLHLSDLQFGDPNFIPAAKLLNERILAQYIVQDLKKKVDFVIISGDIAYSGLPTEFESGYTWITQLAKLLLPESFNNLGERILIVPGNHDVNLSLNSADFFTYDFSKQKSEGEGTHFLKLRDIPIQDHQQFGLLPFSHFAYKLTNDLNWIGNDFGNCFINDRFLSWGLRFIHLNTVMELGYLNPLKVSLVQNKIKELVNSAAQVSDNIFTTIIAHNGPEDFGYVLSGDQPQSVADLFSFINAMAARLYLYGHRHKPEKLRKVEYEGIYTSLIQYSQAGSISLNKNLQASDSRRSFSIIEFTRNDGKVNKMISQIYEIDGQRIYEADFKKNQIEIKI